MSPFTASTDPVQSLYDADFHAWAMAQAQLLRQGRFSEADIAHIAEEIEDLGNEQIRALASAMRNVLVHLSLLRFSPATDPRAHWAGEIANFRIALDDRLDGSPSLRRHLHGLVPKEWKRARRIATLKLGEEMKLIGELPKESPFTLEEIMDDDFFPAFSAEASGRRRS
ncbi:DUF29 domain-containing protein [Noviherbaspirillum pedocola]|nr:DUF29 domain-containing protein [Noviherbaspirillum pedocola]